MGSERFVRQAFARPLPPDRVPDLVLIAVLSCPFYGVTPVRGSRFRRGGSGLGFRARGFGGPRRR
jgi:hypothetical protein